MNFKCKILFLIFLVLLSFSGCGKLDESVSQSNNAKIQFIDDDGKEISLEKPAQRIISMYSAHTENIYYLGAGDKLIGGYNCIYPPEAAFLDEYDYKGDPEQVIAAQPDLLLIRPFIRQKAPDYIKTIENAGIPVVSLYPSSFDEFDEYINKLALLTATEQNAKKLLDDFHNEINTINIKTTR